MKVRAEQRINLRQNEEPSERRRPECGRWKEIEEPPKVEVVKAVWIWTPKGLNAEGIVRSCDAVPRGMGFPVELRATASKMKIKDINLGLYIYIHL